MADSAFRCFVCKEQENDKAKIVMCANCCKCEHFTCKGVIGAAAEVLRQKKYYCSLECSQIASSMLPLTGTDNTLQTDIRDILMEVRKVQATIGDMQLMHAKLEAKLESKMDTLLTEMKTMKSDYVSLKEDVEELQHEHNAVNETVTSLQIELDRINRAALSKHAIIMGVPVIENEDVKQVVTDIAAAVQCQLPADSIVEAKRIVVKESSGKSVPIKVVFAEIRQKEELFTKKKIHGLLLSSAVNPTGTGNGSGGSRIILRDELTSFGMKLLKEVRAVQEQTDLKYVWPGRNGVILAKAQEGSKVESIRNMQDLQKLQRMHNKRQLDDSILNSTSIDEPNSKRYQQQQK